LIYFLQPVLYQELFAYWSENSFRLATIQGLALSVNPVALRRINLGCRHMMPSGL